MLQARASLSDIPLGDLEDSFALLYKTLRTELLPFFMTKCPVCNHSSEIQFTLYGLRKYCECGPALFIDSYILRKESNGSIISICPSCYNILYNGTPCNCQVKQDAIPIFEKDTASCSVCGGCYREEHEQPYAERYTPLTIVGHCNQHGLFFKPMDDNDRNIIEHASQAVRELSFGSTDDFRIRTGPKSDDLIKHGVFSYIDLFSPRQLLYVYKAIRLLQGYEPLIHLNLAMLVSTSLEFNSMLCGYKGSEVNRPGAIRHVFSHHAYSIPYTALENNPVGLIKTSGTLQSLFHAKIRNARKWAIKPVERKIFGNTTTKVVISGERDVGTEVFNQGELESGSRRFLLIEGSSIDLDLKPDSIDFVVTDPPYFDNVQYSDLAAFFRVWLKKLVPGDHRWEYDLNGSAVDPHANGNGQYTTVLSGIFTECYRMLKKEDGRLIFTYHHWNPKAWAALTIALKQARFQLVNRYVVQAENPSSVHINGLKSLKHDAILVLAPVDADIFNQWHHVSEVEKNDSYQFCEDCASALGWILQQNVDVIRIEEFWSSLI